MSNLLTGVVIAAFGISEGYAFFRTGMTDPSAIQDQMSFRSMIVMKLFISAVGTSMLVQAAMDFLHPARFKQSRIMSKTSVGYPRAMGGCFLLGTGMYLTGAGPTIIPAQLFGGATSAIYVTIGALLGGAAFSLVEKQFFAVSCPVKPGEVATVDEALETRYYVIAAPIGAALVGTACLLDLAWPHRRDVARLNTHLLHAWSPVLAGAVIGLNQLPLRYLAGKGQGGSTAVMNAVATLSFGKLSGRYAMTSILAASQFLYVWVGTSIGAYLALQQQQSTFIQPVGPPALRSLLGGAVLLFGARIAQGCTCGHGISGMSELSFQSLAAGASIFAGGMFAALISSLL
jgi:hypothetical protein